MKIKFTGAALLAVGLIATSGSVFAQIDDTATFTVGIQISDECTIVANDLTFDPAGLLTELDDGTTTIDVTCTPGTDYNVGLSNGANSDDAPGGATRAMSRIGGGPSAY